MTERIGSFASNNELVTIILETQRRLQRSEVEVASQKKAQVYSGIADQSERLVNLENKRDSLDRFVTENELVDLRLNILNTNVEGIEDSIEDFRQALLNFDGGGIDVETRVKDVQDAAFRTLKDLEIFLNSDVDGRFLFAGSRVTSKPADLNLTTLANFQTTFDGDAVVYPITRTAALSDFTTTVAATGNITFDATAETITAATAGAFTGIPVGAKITVAGSTSNNGDFTVVANTGTVVTVTGTIAGTAVTVNGNVAANEVATAATLSATPYYGGDSVARTHRVANDRDFTQDLTAINPSFEKAIRSLGIIAQGVFGTAGGLDAHPERIEQALFLVNSALDPAVPGTPPFGAELSNNIETELTQIGFKRVLIDQTNRSHKELIVFFETRVSDVEDADRLESVTKLIADQQVLEASFRALAQIRNLSLADFLI